MKSLGIDDFLEPVNITSICAAMQKAKNDAFAAISNLGIQAKLEDANSIMSDIFSSEQADLTDEIFDEERDIEVRQAQNNVSEEFDRIESGSEGFNVQEDFEGEISLKDYSTNYNIGQESSSLLEVVDSVSKKFIRKTSYIWLLGKESAKLSSDRLERVKDTGNMKTTASGPITAIQKLETISIGQWCIFSSSLDQRGLIGQVHDFGYMMEKKLKDIKYSGDSAYIARGTKILGVQCTWFDLHSNGNITIKKDILSHGYIDITSYVITIPPPVRMNGGFYISETFYDEVQKYTENVNL